MSTVKFSLAQGKTGEEEKAEKQKEESCKLSGRQYQCGAQ